MTRVLVILPFYGGSLPIGRYCAAALKDCGCLVDVFEAPDFFSAFSALKDLHIAEERLDFLENSFLHVISQSILAKAEQFQPDLVLCMAQAPMSRKALQRLKSLNITTAMWFVEDYKLFPYWRTFAPHYDMFAVIQKDPFLTELASIGVNHALYLPLAALPTLHAPTSLTKAEQIEYSADVSFLGAGYPNRQKAFVQLTNHDFKIWGTEWEDEPILKPFVQRKGARISPEDAQKIYNATAININLHSSIYAEKLVSHGDFVNPRTFELAACGAFQLVDDRTLLPELFADDELTTFSSFAEFKEQITHYLKNPKARVEVTEKSRARVLKDHTYQHRMRTLLDYVTTHFPSQKQETTPWPEGMPQAMQDDLNDIFKETKLPTSASFSDLIIAVKNKEGQLSDTETALLFFAEWQKQYLQK